MRRKIIVIFAVLILGFSFFLEVSVGHGQVSQSEVELGLQNATWNHSTLRVLIVTEEGESWWQSNYANSTLRAVGIWNDAIASFASNYSGFRYLSRLSMVPTVSDSLRPGFDAYISWTSKPLDEGDESVGLAVTYSVSGVILNCTITLGVRNMLGTELSEVDMQNIALHEIGHSLGLNHCNYTSDAMYPASLLGSPARAVSTMDTYGVASVFGWMANSNQPNPAEDWPKTNSVTLPPEIEYRYFEISSENIPPYSNLEPVIGPLRVILDTILMFVSLQFLIVIIVVVVILVVALTLYRRRR